MPEDRVLLRNRRAQPVELHLPGGVLVLPPRGERAVPGSCLEHPQLAWLLARKALDTRALPAPPPAPAAARPMVRAQPVPMAAAMAAAPARGKRRASKT